MPDTTGANLGHGVEARMRRVNEAAWEVAKLRQNGDISEAVERAISVLADEVIRLLKDRR